MPERRLRILLVTRNLPPLVGGMERLNWHLAAELARVADVCVVGPQGSAALAPAKVRVREVPLKPLWKFLLHARALARREARAWKPDWVLAGSGLTAPLAWSAARRCGAKTAVYVHGLDVAVKHPVYRAIWLPALRRTDRVIANSHATAQLCLGIGVDAARIGIVHPGVDLPRSAIPFDPPSQAKGEEVPTLQAMGEEVPTLQAKGKGGLTPFGTKGVDAQHRGDAQSATPDAVSFRARHNLGDRPLLLSVGRLSTRKGLREFVALALPKIAAAYPDIVLLIVGDAPNDALHAQAQTPASIRAVAARAGIANSLRFLGTITDYAELGCIYHAANVHVFPVRKIAGDPEGFGMVAVEAAAHGLPTVAFATGGVVDAVAEGQSGHLVPPGDYATFADAVRQALVEGDRLRASCQGFAQQFAWSEFGRRILTELSIAPRRSD